MTQKQNSQRNRLPQPPGEVKTTITDNGLGVIYREEYGKEVILAVYEAWSSDDLDE